MRMLKRFFDSIIGQIILMLLLLLIIFVEVRTSFNILYKREMDAFQVFNDIAASSGKARVSIDTVTTYEEMPFTYTEGDVISVSTGEDSKPLKVKLSGVMTDDSYQDYGYYYYSDPDNISATLTVLNGDLTEDISSAVHDFWYGDTSRLFPTITGGQSNSSDLTFYQCSLPIGDYPALYDPNTKLFYMLVTNSERYTILQAPNPFILTTDKVTVHFGDPSINYPTAHSYSSYETLAAENTIRKIKEKEAAGDEEVVFDNPYQTAPETQNDMTSTNYVTDTDNSRRDQMVKLGEYTWDSEGHSTETSLTVDISSVSALQSQWVLTATSYTYEVAGLRISALNANRSSSLFTISGNINNTLTMERPYVMVLKFLDSQNKLLGIKVLDNRYPPLSPQGVNVFSVSVGADEFPIANIASVMFDCY